MTKLEGVLIDLGGVLCDVDEPAMYAAWEAHTKLSAEALRAELYDRGLKEEFDRGLKHPAGVAMFLKYRFEIELARDDWQRIWTAAVNANTEMDALAAGLAQMVPTALASNTDQLHHEKLKGQLSCLDVLKAQAVSYEIGHLKPDPRFYARALDLIGTPAAGTLFIDDVQDNVDGAIDAGMMGLLFKGLEPLRESLHAYGLVL